MKLFDGVGRAIDRVVGPVDRLSASLPTSARVGACLLAAAALAFGLATIPTEDATFSINADTRVFAVEPACGQQLVWDLPAGAIGVPRERGAAPKPSTKIGVSLRGGARARVEVDGEGRWLIELGQSGSFGCGTAPDLITVNLGDRTETAGTDEVWFYRSSAAVSASTSPVLLLKGRVVIGDEIPFGRASAGVGAPLLERAHIDVRTPDAQTHQRRQIHDETIDPGGMIDTHACLDEPREPPQRYTNCLRTALSATEGFFRALRREDRPGLEVQLVVTGKYVGVRQQGGSERRVLVTWWSSVKSSTLVQMFAAAMALIAGLVQLWSALKRKPN